MYFPVVPDPSHELSPTSIVNALGEVPVLHHVVYLKVFVGNQVVRADERVRCLASEIFTLPGYLQIALCQMLSGFLPVLRLLVFTRDPPMQTLQAFFSLAVVTRILNRVSFAIGQERFQSDIDPDLLACWVMHDFTCGLYPKLTLVAIGPLDNTNPLDLPDGKRFDLLLFVSNEPHTPNATAVCEGDMLPIRQEPPPCLFVFH